MKDRANLDDVLERAELLKRAEIKPDRVAKGLFTGDVVDSDVRNADIVPDPVIKEVYIKTDVFAGAGAADLAAITEVPLDMDYALEPVVGRIESDTHQFFISGDALQWFDGLVRANFEIAEIIGVSQNQCAELLPFRFNFRLSHRALGGGFGWLIINLCVFEIAFDFHWSSSFHRWLHSFAGNARESVCC